VTSARAQAAQKPSNRVMQIVIPMKSHFNLVHKPILPVFGCIYAIFGLELITYNPDNQQVYSSILGPSSDQGQWAQAIIAGHWQAARPLGAYTLVGCTVEPGFDFRDFDLVADLPEHQAVFANALANYASLL
jgi:predicted cupin superfamily sugar epimerase